MQWRIAWITISTWNLKDSGSTLLYTSSQMSCDSLIKSIMVLIIVHALNFYFLYIFRLLDFL